MSHKTEEEEEAYLQRLTAVHSQCGYPLTTDDFAARFIDGLDSRIRSLVRRFRAANRGVEILELFEEASTEGAAMQARAPKRAQDPYSRVKTTMLANFLDKDCDPIYFASEEAEREACSALSDLAQSQRQWK